MIVCLCYTTNMIKEKKCSKCGEVKSSDQFYKDSSNTSGLYSCCKACKQKYAHDRWRNDPEYRAKKKIEDSKRTDYRKKYIAEKRKDPAFVEKRKEYMKEYHNKVDWKIYVNKKIKEDPTYRDKLNESARKYRENNREKCLEAQKKSNAKRRSTQEYKDWRNDYEKKQRDNNPEYRMLLSIRVRINKSIVNKTESSKALLGCSMKFFTKYIREMFVDDMSWENYGSVWHLDHIVPCNHFDMTKPYNQKICFNYRNYQPLTVYENCSKQDDLPDNYLEIISDIKKALQMED